MNTHVLLPRLARPLTYALAALALAATTFGTMAAQAATSITLRSVSTGNSASGSTSLALAKPSTTASGDLLVAQVVVRPASSTITAPGGWRLIRLTASGTALRLATYYKVAASSEPPSYTWSLGGAETAIGGISDLAGVNTSSPIDASSGKVNASTATAAFTQVTTTVPNDLLLAFVGVAGNTSVTPPSGYTESYDRNDAASASGSTAEVSRHWKSTTGATAVGSAKENTLAVTNVTQLVAVKPAPAPITIVAVGDIHCTTTDCQDTGVNSLVAHVAPAAFFPDGDLVFSGTAANYNNYYNPNFGQFKPISHPAIGNHDGVTAYFDYWDGVGATNGPAGPRGKGWYSFNMGSWHVVVLNSNCIIGRASYMISCAPGSEELTWLQSDLAAHPHLCTIAFMHIPYYTSEVRQFPELQPVVQMLYNYRVDLLVSGHTHDYQRYYPQDGNGNRVSNGVTQFVVGTGGGTLANAGNIPTAPNEAVQIGHEYGVLKLVLKQGSYSFQFLPAPGYTGTDSGSGVCH